MEEYCVVMVAIMQYSLQAIKMLWSIESQQYIYFTVHKAQDVWCVLQILPHLPSQASCQEQFSIQECCQEYRGSPHCKSNALAHSQYLGTGDPGTDSSGTHVGSVMRQEQIKHSRVQINLF